MAHTPHRVSPKVQLDYFQYEIPDDPTEKLSFAIGQLQVASIRLGNVLGQLKEAAPAGIDVNHVGLQLRSLEYHGETFLTAIYEFRERLTLVLALLTDKTKEHFMGGGRYEKVQAALKKLRSRMPIVADEINALENHICSSVAQRNRMTHGSWRDYGGETYGSFLHLALLVDGYPYDPEDVLAQYKSDNERSQILCDVLSKEIGRFIAAREADSDLIEEKVSKIAQALGSA